MALAAPSITLSSLNESSVTVTIVGPVTGATRYAVRVVTLAGTPVAHDSSAGQITGPRTMTVGDDTASNGADYPLTPGTTYRAECKAGDAATWGPWSPQVEFTTAGNPPPPVPLPTPETGVNLSFAAEVWTAHYGGVLLGGPSAIVLQEITGLLDAPEIRSSDKALLQRDGLVTGTDYLGGRIVHLSCVILDGPKNVEDTLAAFQPGGPLRPFRFNFPGIAGGAGRLMAKVRKRDIKLDQAYAYGAVRLAVELFCPDPLLYSDTEATTRVLPVTPRGSVKVFPLKFPFGFMRAGAVGMAAPVPITVGGTTPTWPTYTITGPVSSPSITNRATSERIAVQIDVPPREVLTIDTRNRAVLLNGASRYGNLTADSRWFPLRPGVNDLVLDDLLGDKNRTAVARWRSAWL